MFKKTPAEPQNASAIVPVTNHNRSTPRVLPRDPGEYWTDKDGRRIYPNIPNDTIQCHDPEHQSPVPRDPEVESVSETPGLTANAPTTDPIATSTTNNGDTGIRQDPDRPTPSWVVDITDPAVSKMVDKCEGTTVRINNKLGFDMERWMDAKERMKNRYPDMPENLFKAFVESVRIGGVQVPVTLDQNSYQVIDGNHRLKALYVVRDEGRHIPFAGFTLRAFASDSDMHDFQDGVANNGRQLTRRQKQEKIQEALRRHPDWTDERIGCLFGVDGETVAAQSRKLEALGGFERPRVRVAKDNRTIDVGQATRPTQSSTTVSETNHKENPSPLQDVIRLWAKRRGIYITTAKDLVEMLKSAKSSVTKGIKIDIYHPDAPTKITEWLNHNAAGRVIDRYFLHARDVEDGTTIYQLVPLKLRIAGMEKGVAE